MRLKCAYALQPGTGHLADDLPCQDSVSVVQTEDGCFAVLCDGAGSVPGAEEISRAVASGLAAYAAGKFDQLYAMEESLLKQTILGVCLDSLERAAPGRPAHCTLLMAALHRDGRALLCHLGDGVILTLSGEDSGRVFSWPENGSRKNETFFVSGPNPLRHLRIYRGLPEETWSVLLSSDGISDMLYFLPEGNAVSALEVITGWLQNLDEEAVCEKLDTELNELFRKGTQDDMSLVLLYREPEDSDTPTEPEPMEAPKEQSGFWQMLGRKLEFLRRKESGK